MVCSPSSLRRFLLRRRRLLTVLEAAKHAEAVATMVLHIGSPAALFSSTRQHAGTCAWLTDLERTPLAATTRTDVQAASMARSLHVLFAFTSSS